MARLDTPLSRANQQRKVDGANIRQFVDATGTVDHDTDRFDDDESRYFASTR